MPDKQPFTYRSVRQHIDQKLVVRGRLYLALFAILTIVTIVNTLTNALNPLIPIGAILLGFLVGLAVGRMNHLSWDTEAAKVIGRIDLVGGIIVILYLAFELSRNWLFGHWLAGPALTTFTLALTTGVMLGRVVAMSHGIRRLLQSAGIQHSPSTISTNSYSERSQDEGS